MSGKGSSGWKWLIVLLLLGGGGAAAWYYLYPHSDEKIQYQTTAVKRADIVQVVTATGTLNSVISVQVGSQISGNIKQLFADFNTPVKLGQVVALLDPSTYEAAVNQAAGDLASAKASMELAQLNEKRKRDLATSQAGTQADLDKAVADLHQAEAMVKIKEAALQKSQIDLARCTITAPVDGVVISRNVDVGQTVAAAMTAPILFTIAGDLAKMRIEANVSEADIGGVKEGQETTFVVDAFPGRVFKGRVQLVRYAPITVENVVSYVTVIEVDNEKLELRPGMTANVSIVLAQAKGALAVSNAALRFKPPVAETASTEPRRPSGQRGSRSTAAMAPPSKRTVQVLEGDNLKPVEVEVGITDNINTEVKSGLNEGDNVVSGIVPSPSSGASASSPFGAAPPGGSMPRRGS
jgi:HlyD family secretion protein